MSFVPYPSTPNFAKLKKDLFYVPKNSDEEHVSSRPRKGTFLGTIKLHGTNTSIIYTMSNRRTPQFQSRNLVITPQKDNMGAAAFLSKAPLEALVEEILRIYGQENFTELMICGEWAGEGIQKGVAISSLPRFYAIFNIRIDGHWVDLRQYKTVQAPEHRIYNIVNFQTYSMDIDFESDTTEVLAEMEKLTDEVAAKCPFGAQLIAELPIPPTNAPGPSSGKKKKAVVTAAGEGIVWTLIPEPPYDTELINFKTKADEFLTASKAPRPPRPERSGNLQKAEDFVDFALAERRFEQGIEYLRELGKDPTEIRNVGEFIKWVGNDVIKEEGWRMEEMDTNEKDVRKVASDRSKAWYIEYGKRET